ncbi:MAG: peptidase [Deltaproteobacteria bacterium]|nr:MAG: peptidase [Deltaproteobacteria bacterium]
MTRCRTSRPAGAATAFAGALIALLLSCGGGSFEQGLPPFPASRCAVPRPGVDAQGTLADEKAWLRQWTDQLYLWYREVPASDPATFPTALAYFDVLKTMALTPSGNPKDRFHFTIPTADWVNLSQSGVEAGYGVAWALVAASRPRDVRAAYTDPSTPAAAANIARGAKVLTVDGVDVTNGPPDPLNAGLFPARAGETHTFSILDPGMTTPRDVRLTSANVQSTPVQNVKTLPGVTAGTTVGYMLFNDQIATSESLLIKAITQLKQAGVTELVLDIRYNGGGFLVIASELAFMIAGPAATNGKTFEQLAFNDKYPTIDPVTGQPITPEPFQATAVGLSATSGQPLPSLGLGRVFVITGPGTCSASESIMNGLRGIDVQAIQIGSPTCGKPYGFYPADNCGTTYFSIEFQGVNAKGFGDYPDGFIPGGTGATGLPGCQVADDFGHALGDPSEARLSAALQYAAGQPCPPATGAQPPPRTALSAPQRFDGLVAKPPWRESRILRR